MPTPTPTHCPQGHEYTEENTRFIVRKGRIRQDGKPYTERRCRACDREKSKTFREENRELQNSRTSVSSKKRLKQIRAEAIGAYGGQCSCCGEKTPEFLHLDHVNNNGAAHRKEITGKERGSGGSLTMLRWAKKNNWPNTLQLLCHNCGMADAWYGSCPHKAKI